MDEKRQEIRQSRTHFGSIQNVGRRRLRELVNNFSSFVFGKGEVGQISDMMDLE